MKLYFPVLATVAASLILLGAGCSAMKDTANQQLDALRAGDINQAFNYVAQSAADTLNRPTFERLVADTPELSQNSASSFNNYSVTNKVGTLKGTLTSTSGSTVAVEYKLIEDGDNWKITNILINNEEPFYIYTDRLQLTDINFMSEPEDAIADVNGEIVLDKSKIKKFTVQYVMNQKLKAGDKVDIAVYEANSEQPAYEEVLTANSDDIGQTDVFQTFTQASTWEPGVYTFKGKVGNTPRLHSSIIVK